jgi:hypothetical protein
MTCEHALEDGAYVLGALSPAERAEFERHLSGCASCRESVANLAVLPGLLGRLDPARAVALREDQAPVAIPATVLQRVLTAAGRQRRRARRRRIVLATTLAAVVMVLLVGVGVAVHLRDVQPSPPIAMSAMRPASAEWIPVGADVGVVPDAGGSRLVMTCWYASGYEGRWVLRLVVIPRAGGDAETIGTWTADPGAKVTVSGRTHLTPDEIGRVELRRWDNTTLLWWTPT